MSTHSQRKEHTVFSTHGYRANIMLPMYCHGYTTLFSSWSANDARDNDTTTRPQPRRCAEDGTLQPPTTGRRTTASLPDTLERQSGLPDEVETDLHCHANDKAQHQCAAIIATVNSVASFLAVRLNYSVMGGKKLKCVCKMYLSSVSRPLVHGSWIPTVSCQC